jgi:hypothetical protein
MPAKFSIIYWLFTGVDDMRDDEYAKVSFSA